MVATHGGPSGQLFCPSDCEQRRHVLSVKFLHKAIRALALVENEKVKLRRRTVLLSFSRHLVVGSCGLHYFCLPRDYASPVRSHSVCFTSGASQAK